MTTTRTFKPDELRELGLPDNALEDEIVDQGRWSTYHEGVFEIDGEHWQIGWSEGSTEYQYEEPWEYDDEVVGTKVVHREVTVKRWVPA